MIDEIEAILDSADVELINQIPGFSEYKFGYTDIQVKNGSDTDKLLDAIRSLQQSLPDDLEERREAAANQLGYSSDISPESVLDDLINGTGSPVSSEPDMCAWKRLLGIHTGDFSAESEYYPPEPDYPEQWLDHMSEESARWLFAHLRAYGFHYVDRGNGKDGAPRELVENGFVATNIVDKSDDPGDFKVQDCPLKAAFLPGGLELPEFIDEEEL